MPEETTNETMEAIQQADGPNSEGTGIIGREAADPILAPLLEHKEGKHAGRKARSSCPHCRDLDMVRHMRAVGDDRYRVLGTIDRIEVEPPAEKDGPDARPVNPSPIQDGPDGDPPPDGEPWPIDGDEDESVGGLVTALWRELNAAEIDKVMPKAIEYGAADLDIMGYVLGVTLNSERARARQWSPAELQELASAFYALGKVARAFGAYAEGRMPSDDCWHDLGVYARIVQVVRVRGGWMR